MAGSSKYPRRERKAPTHLGDPVTGTGSDFEDDDDDDQLFSIDYCYKCLHSLKITKKLLSH